MRTECRRHSRPPVSFSLLTLKRRSDKAGSSPKSKQQRWHAITEYQTAARLVTAETRGSNQEFSLDRRDRHRAFAVVFLALFGLLFFVSPAGAQLTAILQ